MSQKKITIYQGKHVLPDADVNIIIDVLRAFTVSDYAFQQGVKAIVLTSDEIEAFQLRNKNTALSGEKGGGYEIPYFDYGNSPYAISHAPLHNKTLVQKTTNGVAVTLASLNAKHVLVTGYSNAYATAKYVSTLDHCEQINIIASHPSGDDDLACSEYIKAVLCGECFDRQLLEEETVYRILNSDAAKKFSNPGSPCFSILDLSLCVVNTRNNFVMRVEQKESLIAVEKISI